ncbi:MAG: enoyl-CoA hydratase-related protein [Porticoccaceae bacterium]|jgi:enoyl-CoA hydratase|nr:enoyl-CoA hydratase-related protein [Porticoccaceae bacterium]MEA3299497.1 enoyl-CoA hydratase-related protein [Pseudomonadota bacterium]HLS99622.1 enoyl-CoA hydratase-related protein [Porticoccaceae bacterium]
MSDQPQFLLAEMPADHPGVLVVTINRPPANPLNLAMFGELRDIFRDIEQRPEVRAVVLTGAGEKIFCAGADVKEINQRTVESSFDRSVIYRACFDAIHRSPVPVIGAVNGTAIGAGMVLAACCDFVIAADHARFGIPEINVGTLGGTRHAGNMVPASMMRYLALTGETLGAHDLHRVGGVLEVLPLAEVLPRALAIADGIAKKAPKMVRMMREAMNLASEMPVYEGYRLEQLFTNVAVALPESREASAAFLEKREPKFD